MPISDCEGTVALHQELVVPASSPRRFGPPAQRVRFGAALIVCALIHGCVAPRSTQDTREWNALEDVQVYLATAPVVEEPVTLELALEYAQRYNAEVWVAELERAFQRELATQSLLKMLPSLMGGAESSRRSRYDAATSVSLERGVPSLEPSFSSEKEACRYDISATWNLLDFGISFLRARQQAQRVDIAGQRARRVRQNLALEVTRAYWAAVTAREAAREAQLLEAEARILLEKVRKEIAEQTISPIEGHKRETAVLEQLEDLRRHKRNYRAAKAELAALMGMMPGADYRLAEVDLGRRIVPRLHNVDRLEWFALRRRPELFEKDFEEAISRDEARAALAQMFPSITPFWRYDYDWNQYLAFNNWNAAGLRASWDLLAIPHLIKRRDASLAQAELATKRRIALSVAILTQVHLALIDYSEALVQYRLTREVAAAHENLLEAVARAAEEGKSHSGETLEHRMKLLKAQAKHLGALAAVKVADARIRNTVGLDPRQPLETALSTTSQPAGHDDVEK